MDIVVVGTGYVGIVTGTCLAESGNRVICVDIDEEKIAIMEKGKVPIYEPHLESLLIRNLEAERISFTTDLEAAVKASPIVFLALPTPPPAAAPTQAQDCAAAVFRFRAILCQCQRR